MAEGDELTTESLLSDLHKWANAETLKQVNIEKYDLKVYGSDEKVENYRSDIAFVDIIAEEFGGEKREHNLVIKYGQKKRILREKLPIRDGFEREIDIYTRVIPAFSKLQESRNVPHFSCVPRCYLTKFTETEEILILQNLRSIGYEMYNRQLPMSLNHIKLVLEAYAEWHALSFALKYHRKEEFNKIIKRWTTNPAGDYINSDTGKLINFGQERLFEYLEKINEKVLLQKYKELLGNNDARKMLLNLLLKKESQSVILHGDCWSNNFLFKYEENDIKKQNCTKVSLLDFQLSTIGSPVYDISHFIYAVSSEEELQHFKELLDHYYLYFSNHLKRLGCNPDRLMSYSDLVSHWKKYSAYGALQNPIVLMFALVDKDKTPELDKDSAHHILSSTVETDEYKARAVAVARHFTEYKF